MTGRVTKWLVQPNEIGKVEISLDTSRFRGRRTHSLWLSMENGKTIQTKFTITADSQDGPQP